MEAVRKLKNRRLLLVLVLGGCVLLMFLKFGTFSSTETLRWEDTTTSLRHHESPRPSHPNTPGDMTTPTSISNRGETTSQSNSPKITRGTEATASPSGDVFLNPSDRRTTPTNTNAQTITTASLPTAQTAMSPTTPRFLQGPVARCSDPLIDREKKQRIVIIGTGPTGLGAAHRLFELGILNSNTQVIILEQEAIPGGLAKSLPDKRGFLWDMGGHVVFSHYKYFDKMLDDAVLEWNRLTRTAFAFMKDSDNMRKFIPYPVQHNIHLMARENQQKCLKGLEENTLHPVNEKLRNFDEWLVKHFGEGLCEVFMRRYNKKVWTVPTSEMNAV